MLGLVDFEFTTFKTDTTAYLHDIFYMLDKENGSAELNVAEITRSIDIS
jgi:HD superfamily phosphodiesterase